MNVGFTGTRKGMTNPQMQTFREFFSRLAPEIAAFHHGDCVGADAEAHDFARAYGKFTSTKIVIHPPKVTSNRAFCFSSHMVVETREPYDYLTRNRHIVDETDVLLATPKGMSEEFKGSGTWHAVRYARKLKRLIFIFWPNGGTTVEIGQRRIDFGRGEQIPLQHGSSLLGFADLQERQR